MLKVMSLVGTRPELIKMSRVIAELDEQVQHILVHSGQNFDYELNQVFFDELEIRKPDYFLAAASGTAIKTISDVISKADNVFEKEKPDALLLYGDTNTCLAIIADKINPLTRQCLFYGPSWHPSMSKFNLGFRYGVPCLNHGLVMFFLQ